jgi:NADH-quinone oxidoreductase subunit E
VKLSTKIRDAILRLQTAYPEKRSALIPALHLAQSEIGYLPLEIQQEVATLFGIAASEVNGVVTFYDMFHEEKVGKHHLHVCKNVSCMLRGSDELLKQLCERLGINPGETTSDGEFTVIPCECLGACDKAPMMLVDEEVAGPIAPYDLENLLTKAKHSRGHPSPMEIDHA